MAWLVILLGLIVYQLVGIFILRKEKESPDPIVPIYRAFY